MEQTTDAEFLKMIDEKRAEAMSAFKNGDKTTFGNILKDAAEQADRLGRAHENRIAERQFRDDIIRALVENMVPPVELPEIDHLFSVVDKIVEERARRLL